MTEALLIAILNTVAKVGLDAALIIISSLNKPAPTIDDAIVALKSARDKTWEQYLIEAAAKKP